MLNLIKQTLKRKFTYALLAIGVFAFVLFQSISMILAVGFLLATFGVAVLQTKDDIKYTQYIKEESPQVEPEDVQDDTDFNPTKTLNEYTIGNYRFQVKEFVEMFNKAKTQRDWDNVLTLGETIVAGIKVMDSYSTYTNGVRFHSSLEIVRLVGFLRVYLESDYCLGSDIRKVMKLEVDTHRDNVIGIQTNPNTFIQIEARAIRNKNKNKFKQQHDVNRFCFERTYKKRLGRIA